MLWRKSAPASSCSCYSHAGGGSGSSPGLRNLFPSFPGSRLGQGTGSSRGGDVLWQHITVLSAPQPLSFRILHTALQIQPQEICPCRTSHPRETLQAFSPQNLLLPSLLDTPLQDSHSCHQTPACTECLCLCPSWKDSHLEWIHTFHSSEISPLETHNSEVMNCTLPLSLNL